MLEGEEERGSACEREQEDACVGLCESGTESNVKQDDSYCTMPSPHHISRPITYTISHT